MPDRSSPLANRAPAALQELLVSGIVAAKAELGVLTLSELVELAEAADLLAALARLHTNKRCGTCAGPITWRARSLPGRDPGWRHLGPVAAFIGDHQAVPDKEKNLSTPKDDPDA